MESNGADRRTGPVARDVGPVPGPRRQRRVRNSFADRKPAVHGRVFKVLRALLALALILSGIVGIAAFRLSRGPISLAAFKSTIEASISHELGTNTFSVRDAELILGSDGLEIALQDIRITDATGVALAQAPRAVVLLSGQAALRGQIGFSRIALVNTRLQFFYAEDGTLSVKFAQSTDSPQPTAQPPQAAQASVSAETASAAERAGAIDFVKAMTDISAQARKRQHVSAYLREIGLEQTTLVVDNGRRKTIWRVPEIKIDLSHKASRSLIEGRALIDSLTGPWSLDFQTTEIANSQQLVIQAQVAGVNPRGLSRQILSLANFEQVDVPLDGEARLELSSKGVVGAATFALTARDGRVLATHATQRTGHVEAGSIKGAYDGQAARFTFAEASLSMDRNRLDLVGSVTRAASTLPDASPLWNFEFSSTGGTLAPATPDAAPVLIDQFRVRGQLAPEDQRLALQEIILNAGGAAIAARGNVSDLATDANRAADLEARIAPMPIAHLLPLWPSTLAPDARAWIATHLLKGQLNGGIVKMASTGSSRLSLTLDIGTTEMAVVRGMPSFLIPRATLRLEGGGLEVTVPEASLGSDAKRLQFKGLRFTAVETTDGSQPIGEIAFRVLGPLSTALDLADREPFRLFKSRGIVLTAPEGKLDGQLKLTLPISDALQASDVRVEGHARLTDGRLRQALGPHDITGAKLDVEFSETAIDGRGDFLLKGVPVKFAGQHFLATTPDRQSPLRLSLKLDDADRAQLGLDINDLMAGDVPIEVTIGPDAKGEYQARLDADLTKAELTLDSVAFRKAPGVAARLQFDVARPVPGRTELRNFKIAGDTIAAEGLIVLGPDGKTREFTFPDLSLNTISRVDVQGQLRADRIWDVHAKSATFDGRDLFRELFNVQNQPKIVPKDKPGLDLTAEIDTVLGFNDTNLKTVRLKLQKRNDTGNEKITALDVSAKYETGKSFEARIRSQHGSDRTLTATSDDAGQTFKAIGFYPNANAGDMNLDLALDGRERSGTLKANTFFVFGDQVVSEVFQNGDGQTTTNRGTRKKVVRERIDFEWMVLPFSLGCGQFVMNDVEIRGPLIGARARGKADFKSQRLQIGGTYIPLSGLNSALGGLPVLGQLLAGPKGEGIFGITFAVQGPMGNPEVLINPFSGIVPGILRETQQLTPDSYRITPCSDRPSPAAKTDASRASSAAPAVTGTAPSATVPRGAAPDVITDWSSDARAGRQR